MNARIGIIAAVVLIGGGVAVKAYLAVNGSYVFFDNTTSGPVQLTVDGKAAGEVAPGHELVVTLEKGKHAIVATSGGKPIANDSIDVGSESPFRGLYRLGGAGHYVVVRARYDAAGGGTDFEPVAEGAPYVKLPAEVDSGGIDLHIPDSMNSATTLTYLCRVDPKTETHGCK